MLSSTDPLGNVTNYTYDKEGNLTSLLTASNSLYEYKYDQNGDNGTVKDVVISPREFGSAFDRTTSKSVYVKDVSGKTVEIQDHGTSEYDDSVIRTKYEYDLRDNLSKSIEGNGNYKIYSYDQRDRVTKVSSYENTSSGAKHTLFTTYSYDDRDNVLSMIDYEVSEDGEETIYHYTAYTYDGFNRLTSVAELNTSEIPSDEAIEAKKIKYEYDGKDRLVSISYPDDVSRKVKGLNFQYDSFGYVTKIFASFKQSPDKLLRSYTYTDKYQIDEILEYTDPLSGNTNPLKRKYTYDKFGRVTGIEYLKGVGSEPKEAHYYEYDKCNNITKERSLSSYSKENDISYEVIKDHSYTADGKLTKTDVTEKDEAGTVTKESTITYTYDAAGNMLTEQRSGSKVESITMTYNEFDQLTSLVSKDASDTVRSNRGYVYDGSGNRIKETDSVTLNEVTSSYDSENRLKKVESKTGGTLDYTQVNKYNGSGQRIEKKEGNSVTNYYYDGTKVLYTEDENSDTTSFNMIGLNGNILSTERRDGDTESYYSYIVDIRGSTINLLGENGVSEVSYEYDDYGETVKHDRDASNPIFNEVCYTGGIYDETTGLYNLNARFYDAETNSFISQDTYRGNRAEPSSINLYSYCEGDPITYIDPSGHWVSSVIFGALGAYDGYKYAKKKNLKGAKKAAAIVGGAILGAVNPFKVVKTAKTGYKAYKVAKVTKVASTAKKTTTVAKALTKKSKTVSAATKVVKKVAKPKTVKSAKAVAKKAAKKGPGCFVKGTKVHTKGGFKAIDKIRVGDHVWSENPETNEKALKKVKKIFVREKDSIIRLSINGETIETTDEHPFYLEGYGFVTAKSLEVGDYVRTQDGISKVEEVEKVQLDTPINVYNFEVEGYHTYYVSEAKVLVHNTCGYTGKNVSAHVGKSGKTTYYVGAYKDVYATHKELGLTEMNAHHVGQKSLMRKLVSNYDDNAGIAISVFEEGHIRKLGEKGVLARNTKGITNPRQLLARDIREMRRMYPDIPNSAYRDIIARNKAMYPEMRKIR